METSGNYSCDSLPIPIAKTVFTDNEYENILKPLRSGWVVQGPYVQEFEAKWCAFTGAKHSLATTSCTTALYLCLAAAELEPEDEVILPAFTWIATANVVELTKAKVRFCDIDLNTFNVDVNQIESLINPHTKAIIPVHLFGLAADMDPVNNISQQHDLYVFEDAACGFGAQYNNKHVGTFGNAGCFSFHPRKAITTGEGGMITTNDSNYYEKLRSLRDHGATMSDLQRHLGAKPYLLPEFPYAGFNCRMTDIQAAIGSTQMDRAQFIHDERKRIALKYDDFINTIPWLRKPFSDPHYEHGYQSYVCLFEPEPITISNAKEINKMRNNFMEYLQQHQISTRPGTHAVHLLDYYAKKYGKSNDCPNALIADHCSIALPLFQSLSNNEFEYIKNIILNYKF